MAITKIIDNKGDAATTSNAGSVIINQTTGTISIRSGVHRYVEINEDGFTYYDENNIKRITLGQNASGLQQITVFDSTGKAQILVGQDPKDGSPVVAVAEDGKDVITELSNA